MEQQQLQALLGSLRQGQQAKQSLPGLADRRAEAAALRDQPIAEIDKSTGYMSPFAALAGVMKQERGRKEIADLDPRIAQAQQQVGGAESGLQEYGLKQALAKQALTAANRAEDQGIKQTALELTAANRLEDQGIASTAFDAEQENKRLQREQAMEIVKLQMKPKAGKFSDSEQYEDSDGNIFHVMERDGKTYINDDKGNPSQKSINDLKKYEEDKDKSSFSQNNKELFSGVDPKHKRSIVDADLAIRDINDISKDIDNLSDQDKQELETNAGVIQTMITKGVTPSDLNTFMTESRMSPAAKAYLARLNRFSGKIRNELYGSALTAAEIKLSDLWLPSATGLNVNESMGRVQNILDGVNNKVSAIDNVYGRDFKSRLPKRYINKREREAQKAAEKQAAPEQTAVSPERQKKIDRLAELKAKQAGG